MGTDLIHLSSLQKHKGFKIYGGLELQGVLRTLAAHLLLLQGNIHVTRATQESCTMRSSLSLRTGPRGTMLANMRYNAVMRGSQHYQCHLPNSLETLMCAEADTWRLLSSRHATLPANINRHGKCTRCTGQSSCCAPFLPLFPVRDKKQLV